MSLAIPTQTIHGRLHTLPDQKTAVIFHPHSAKKVPPPAQFSPLYLRYALTMLGTERPFLPSFILDDWGQEINKLKLYKWLHVEADKFPRAELFGYLFNFDETWVETQIFARDLEHSARYTTYVYTDKTAPVGHGRPVHHLIYTNDKIEQPQGTKTTHFNVPLTRARVKWWHIPPPLAIIDEPNLSFTVGGTK